MTGNRAYDRNRVPKYLSFMNVNFMDIDKIVVPFAGRAKIESIENNSGT